MANGDIFTGEWGLFDGPAEFVKQDKPTKSPLVAIQTSLGKVTATVTGDAGIYDELSIDLVTSDGSVLQLAVIGVTESKGGTIHAYVYDGKTDDVAWDHDIHVGKDSYWI